MTQQVDSWEARAGTALVSGRACFARGDHAAAVGAYSEALDALADAEPRHEQAALAAQLYSRRGHSRFIRRDLPGALEDYGRALACDPSLAEAHAYRGLIAYQTGKPIDAVIDSGAAIDLYLRQGAAEARRPELAEAYFNRGNAQYQRRDYWAAIADYTEALALHPDLLDALIYRGVARYQAGDPAGAAADYAWASAHPAATDAQRAAVSYNHGLLLRQQGDLAGAIAAYDAALALQPNDADCLMNRGNARAEGGDLAGAIADYQAALRRNPWLDDGFNICGMARMLAGDPLGAAEDFGRALTANLQAGDVRFNRGCARLQLGDFAGAIDDFSAELERHAPGLKGRVEARERRAELLNNRGLAYHYAGDLAAAIDDYSRSLDQLRLAGTRDVVGERMASTLLNRGVAYHDRALGQLAEAASLEALRAAAADLAQAVELAPDPVLAGEARGRLAEVERLLQAR